MPAAGVSELLNTDDRPVFVVSDDRQARERLAAALTDANGSRPVTAAEPERFADAAETVVPAGLVAVRTDGGEPVPWDAVGSDAPDRSASDARSALAAAVADDRYPAVAVGPDLDVAAAYEAGVDVAVPLALAAHRETIADRVTAAVDRYRGSELRSDLLNETSDGIVVHDPETGEIVDTNDRFYDMLGYDPETDDVTLDDITGHDDEFTRSRAVSLIRDAAAGSPSTFEWRDPTR
jgi:PAS domain-containing protein